MRGLGLMKKNGKSKKTDEEPILLKKKNKISDHQDLDDDKIEVVVERDNGFNTVEVIIIIFISILFGTVVGYFLNSTRTFGTKVSNEVSEIISTYDAILDNYYGDIDKKELADAAVSGMISILDDPYSVYMNSNDTDTFMNNVNGSFVGIGITVEWRENIFTIVDVMKDTSAAKAGLKSNDIIKKIGDKEVDGLHLNDLSALIKGKVGSKVNITVLRGDKEVTVNVKRMVIEIDSVKLKVFDQDIGYLAIDNFSSNTSKQFGEKLEKLENKDIRSLIIDVRDNPGGKLGQVNKVLDLFFDKKTILYKIVSKDKTTNVYANDSKKKNMNVVVLVNHGSASASEILAACFKDNYENSTIVGDVTYGKGTIQKAVELSSGASIKYTTQKWLTPNGKWIDTKGVVPDEIISQPEEYICTDDSNDVQLQKAIEILKNKES